jgi:large subunit ribosomal protein L24
MKIKKGDNVLIAAGKDRGKVAKVLKAFPREEKILVEGVQMRHKHVRPKRQGEKGQTIKVPAPFHVSNVKIVCPKCGKATRLGYKMGEKGKKFRICRKCKAEI